MKDQHKKINGYRDLTQEEINLMNEVKDKEAELGDLFEKLSSVGSIDKRMIALGRTNLQQGFMWTVRAIDKPKNNL